MECQDVQGISSAPSIPDIPESTREGPKETTTSTSESSHYLTHHAKQTESSNSIVAHDIKVTPPKCEIYDPDIWQIVSRPCLGSGEPCEGNFASPGFRMVEWPYENNRRQKFTLFPNLPGEIRNKIWVFSLPEPEVVIVWPGYFKRRFIARKCNNDSLFGNLLSICRESRSIFLAHYQPLQKHDYMAEIEKTEAANIRNRLHTRRKIKPNYRMLYIDGCRDTLMIDVPILNSAHLEFVAEQLDISQIQHLAVCHRYRKSWFCHPTQKTFWKLLEDFCPKLKTLSCVFNTSTDIHANWVRPESMFYSRFGLVTLDDTLRHSRVTVEYPMNFTMDAHEREKSRWENRLTISHLIGQGFQERQRVSPYFDHDGSKIEEFWNSVEISYSLVVIEDQRKWWDAEVLYLVPKHVPDQEISELAHYTIRPIQPYRQNETRQIKWGLEGDNLAFFFPSTENYGDIKRDDMYEGVRRLFETETLRPENFPPTDRNISGFRVFTGCYDYADHQPFPQVAAHHDWSLSKQAIRIPGVRGLMNHQHTLLCERRENSKGTYFTQGWDKVDL